MEQNKEPRILPHIYGQRIFDQCEKKIQWRRIFSPKFLEKKKYICILKSELSFRPHNIPVYRNLLKIDLTSKCKIQTMQLIEESTG